MGEGEIDTEVSPDKADRKIIGLERDLEKVSKANGRKIVWGIPALVILAIAANFALAHSETLALATAAGIALLVFGGLPYVMFANARARRKILIQRGFQCQSCGYLPPAINVSGVYYSKECIRCKAKLNI